MSITIKPTLKQAKCWIKLNDKTTRFVLFGGGAGSAKSWLGCEWLLLNCLAHPGIKLFVGRNQLKRIMRSTFITFQKVCKWHNIPSSCWKLNSQYNYVKFWNGSRIELIDVAYQPQDPLYERFGSEEYTSGWLEEVGEIKAKAFDVLKSRIGRHMNKEFDLFPKIFLTCNPKKNWVYHEFYKPWKANELPANKCFIRALYVDNPFTAEEYGRSLDEIRDPVLKARLRDGLWEYDEEDSALMSYDNILAIFDREPVHGPNDQHCQTVDIARFGRDKAVIFLWLGFHIRKVWFYEKSSATFLEEKIKSVSKKYRFPMSRSVLDADGIGGPIVDHLPGVYAFMNGAPAIKEFDDEKKYREQETDRFKFKNLRSQCYSKLADAVNLGKISCYKEIDPQVKEWIIEELEAIKKKDVEDNEKIFQVISKEEIKEDIRRSPDFCFTGDTVVSTVNGYKRIDEISIGDEVITPFGFKRVSNVSCRKVNELLVLGLNDGRVIRTTKGHKFYSNRRFINADSLMVRNELESDSLWNLVKWRLKKILCTKARNTGFRQLTENTTPTRLPKTEKTSLNNCITKYGKTIITRKFPKASVFTILMEIISIMRLRIWKLWIEESIKGCIKQRDLKIQHIGKGIMNFLKRLGLKLLNGIGVKKEGNGIENMQKQQYVREKLKPSSVCVVEKSLNQKIQMRNAVVITAFKNIIIRLKSIFKKGTVFGAVKSFLLGQMKGLSVVRAVVLPVLTGVNVYNLTVEEDCVYYANGVLVSNSDAMMQRMVFGLGMPSDEEVEVCVEW